MDSVHNNVVISILTKNQLGLVHCGIVVLLNKCLLWISCRYIALKCGLNLTNLHVGIYLPNLLCFYIYNSENIEQN